MHIDHLIIATADLDAATARFEAEFGLVATGGGRHTGIGTENRTIPLGRGYLEVITVADAQEAEATPLGRELAARIRQVGEGLMGWAVAVPDIDEAIRRTGAQLSVIERQGLRARLAGVAASMAEPCLPFFIQRDAGIADPGEGGAGGIEWLEVAGDEQRLRDWLGAGADDLPVRVTPGGPAILRGSVAGHVLD